jgi:hypothetical protein
MKKPILALILVSATVASNGFAATLLLDFGPNAITAGAGSVSPAHADGWLTPAESNWNTLDSPATTTSLIFADGASTAGSITLTVGRESAAGSGVIDYSLNSNITSGLGTGGGTPNHQVLVGAGSIYGANAPSTIQTPARDGFFATDGRAIGIRVDGLEEGTYAVYTMARNTNSNVSPAVPMGIHTTTGNPSGSFDFSPVTPAIQANIGYTTETYANEFDSFISGNNYVMSFVTLKSGESLYLAVDGTGSETRGFLNAVAIVSVPEPGTAGLLALSALVVASRRRRLG